MAQMILTYEELKGYILRITLRNLAVITCSLPFFGFIFCIFWSVVFNFDNTVSTHCQVSNYLPSISAAIGNNLVQYVVWCIVVTLHFPFRFLFISIYYRHNKKIIKNQKQYLGDIAAILSIIENISLLGLTYVTSSSIYAVHEKCFITFISSSELYMMLTCYMLQYASNNIPGDKIFKLSVQLKRNLVITNMICFAIAGYCFVRHNEHCEPGVYTCFAFFEYLVVFTNMAFHLTAALDFKDQMLIIDKRGFEIR